MNSRIDRIARRSVSFVRCGRLAGGGYLSTLPRGWLQVGSLLHHNLGSVADELSEADFKAFHRLVQDMALSAYPNPDRIGCPEHAALEEVASLPLSSRHELSQTHINRCSECLRELLEIRRRNYRQRVRLRRKRSILTACAASVILAAGITLMVRRQSTSGPYARIQSKAEIQPELSRVIDLRPFTVERSARPRAEPPPIRLPASPVQSVIFLPVGVEPADYEIRVLDSELRIRANASGSAKLENYVAVIRTRLDLGGLTPGRYTLLMRRPGDDWRQFPLVIEPPTK